MAKAKSAARKRTDAAAEEEQLAALHVDLCAIAEKHGIRYAAFCGMIENSQGAQFYGRILGDSHTRLDLFEATLNVGRLWQHVRGEMRRLLNTFDGWPSK